MKKKTLIKKFYSSGIKAYDSYMYSSGHYFAQLQIFNQIQAYFAEPILDLASGHGFLLNEIGNNFFNVQGNDFSKAMQKYSSSKYNLNITNFDANNFPIDYATYNTILCCNLFFYIQNREKALSDWSRMLNPSGKLIFMEEYPFVCPEDNVFPGKTLLSSLVTPFSPNFIISLSKKTGLTYLGMTKKKIDEKHSLYGLVFEK